MNNRMIKTRLCNLNQQKKEYKLFKIRNKI